MSGAWYFNLDNCLSSVCYQKIPHSVEMLGLCFKEIKSRIVDPEIIFDYKSKKKDMKNGIKTSFGYKNKKHFKQ